MPEPVRPSPNRGAYSPANQLRGLSQGRAEPPRAAGVPPAHGLWPEWTLQSSGSWLLLALVAVLLGAACQAHAQAGPQQARGLITNVQARSIVETEAITVRTEAGQELILRVD